MTIMGINFTKMNVERKTGKKGKINISNNVSIINVEKVKMNFGGEKQQTLKFSFKFISKYDPDIGEIALEGDLIFLVEEKQSEEILKNWEKNKKVEPELMTGLLNNILNKCNIEAIILSKEIGLPAPIPLPKISKSNQDEGKKQS